MKTKPHQFDEIAFDDLDHVAGGAGEGGLDRETKRWLFDRMESWWSGVTGVPRPGSVDTPVEDKAPALDDGRWWAGSGGDESFAGGDEDDE